MSKRKPNKLFRVYQPYVNQIYVVARHGKGALTIARTEWGFGSGAKAEEADRHFMNMAVNCQAEG